MARQVKYEGVMIHKHIRMLYFVMLKLNKESFSLLAKNALHNICKEYVTS